MTPIYPDNHPRQMHRCEPTRLLVELEAVPELSSAVT
jgi:hypothetical protein